MSKNEGYTGRCHLGPSNGSNLTEPGSSGAQSVKYSR
jgi:hypothetical protein